MVDAVSRYILLHDFTPSSSDDAASNTVSAVRNLCNPSAQKRLKLDVSSFLLICNSSSHSSHESEKEKSGIQFVKELAEAARTAAPAHACSSVLAGHASESDDYADVGLWMDAGSVSIDTSTATERSSEKNARAVLSSLGLESLLSSEAMPSFSKQITPLSLSGETNVPVSFKASAQDADVEHLASLLAQLSHRFAFSAALDGTVFHFLLGQTQDGGAWAGLLGAGTWSD